MIARDSVDSIWTLEFRVSFSSNIWNVCTWVHEYMCVHARARNITGIPSDYFKPTETFSYIGSLTSILYFVSRGRYSNINWTERYFYIIPIQL